MTRSRHDGIQLLTLDRAHVPAAAALVTARVLALRDAVPSLPASWTDEAVVGRLIGELVDRGSGAAAIRNDRLVGFQAATLIDGHGGRWAYTPDIGHAIEDAAGGRVVEALYARLADAWVREACLEHVVTVLAHDTTTIDALARLGFGGQVIDLVRDLSPVERPRPPRGVTVRRAGRADAASIVELDAGLRRHLASSPIFLRTGPARSPELQRRTLDDASIATFVAEVDRRAIAMLRIGPSATDVATIVRDPGTASITAAFTVAERRGDGIASLLLDAALRWARVEGYLRAAVDHESANGEAFRFWARHFAPVAVSLIRRVPPSVAP